MTHRGPDGSGLLFAGGVGLGHRRLAVIDRSSAGDQPMVTRDGRHALVYNGELYNDAELRKALADAGVRFRSTSDAETLLESLALWGEGVLERLRGMFAFAWHDRVRRRLVLVRDGFGNKPLYWWMGATPGGIELVFASEVGAILHHPHVPVRPDWGGVSAYLSTIRTSLDGHTMFEGVRAVRAGECLTFDLSSDELPSRSRTVPPSGPARADIGDVLSESVRRHMRADVPVCSMLSGGLDSTIIAFEARGLGPLHTYAAGTPSSDPGDDLACAQAVAEELKLRHTSVEVSREVFVERWREMIERLGVPLSTPNEVAINEVARRMRRDGFVVALSGEGADELFAGYDRPLTAARAALQGAERLSPELFAEMELAHNAWTPPGLKESLLHERVWRGLEGDARLHESLRRSFEASMEACGGEALRGEDAAVRVMLEYQRRVNLAGLLGRLDTSTMLESIEGRTPFADACVLSSARALPTERLIAWRTEGALTKVALRDAYEGRIPSIALRRAKASFPLPFTEWLDPLGAVVQESCLLRELFKHEAIEAVAGAPGASWRLAWPMINLALWGERWWGGPKEQRPVVMPGVAKIRSS